jgi:hypothetical protein
MATREEPTIDEAIVELVEALAALPGRGKAAVRTAALRRIARAQLRARAWRRVHVPHVRIRARLVKGGRH